MNMRIGLYDITLRNRNLSAFSNWAHTHFSWTLAVRLKTTQCKSNDTKRYFTKMD